MPTTPPVPPPKTTSFLDKTLQTTPGTYSRQHPSEMTRGRRVVGKKYLSEGASRNRPRRSKCVPRTTENMQLQYCMCRALDIINIIILSSVIIIIVIMINFFLFAIRQLQVIPQIFYSTSHFTMLTRLIHTYPPCVDYSPCQSNVLSNVIMCLTTSSCVSDATLYVRIVSSALALLVKRTDASKPRHTHTVPAV